MVMTRVIQMTATDLLDLHVGLWPMHLMLYRVCHRAALRLTSLPEDHPLHAVFCKRAKHYIKTPRSLLHELAMLYKSIPSGVETLNLVCSPPAGGMKAKITVDGTTDPGEKEACKLTHIKGG